ncbi:BglG family transcription antiterminator [Liquorilactobacillus oeni]|uniref:Sorbitol operon transcription regulator n=1 Tax=Liquorilactobacillus oeni DSM 19972 TaxID=1423777 RepID=A0A0R1MD98_9LACO|nr:HTH domain-containing protein [Liquorilactobacillus oeni]KRL06012.1 sorbitol operon transcription regulator [Liquorilactobacillus oeni DSM 19972]
MNGREYLLLKYFIVNDSVVLEELIAQFHISKRTLLKYIVSLNENLQEIAEIKNNQGRYYLKVKDYKRLTSLQTSFLKLSLDLNDPLKRRAFITYQLIKANGYIVLEDLAEKLSISKGTLVKDLASLKDILREYDVKITSVTNNGIRLSVKKDYVYGLLLANLVCDYYPMPELNFDELKQKKLMGLISKIDTTEKTEFLVKRNISIILNLIRHGHRIKEEIPFYKNLFNTDTLADFVKYLKDLSPKRDGFTQTELQFICYPFNIKFNSKMDSRLLNKSLEKVKKMYTSAAQIVKQKVDVQLDYKHFFLQTKYHLLFMMNRVVFKSEAENILSDEAIEKYPIALELSLETASFFEKYTMFKISKSEINYLTIYYQMELEEKQGHQVSLKAAIVGPISRSIKKLIVRQLNEIMLDYVEVDAFNTISELERSHEKYLIIFSNYPVRYEDKNVPVVRINSVFRTEELTSKIRISFVEDAILEKYCKLRVTRLDSKLGYLKGTKQMIQQEINAEQLTENFLKTWIKREKKASNVFENGISIPHIIDDSSHKRILLTIGIFDKDTVYQNRKVRVVFLIGIPQKLEPLLSKTLSEVYDLIFSISRHGGLYNNLLNYNKTLPFSQIAEGI